jgi:hypothetical protein
LNPNGIFHVFVFVHFCKACLGSSPAGCYSESSSASGPSPTPTTQK